MQPLVGNRLGDENLPRKATSLRGPLVALHSAMIGGVQVAGFRYVVHGTIRGFVSTHRTKRAAERALALDARARIRAGSWSDARVYRWREGGMGVGRAATGGRSGRAATGVGGSVPHPLALRSPGADNRHHRANPPPGADMLPVRRQPRPASTATPVLLGLLFVAATIAAVVGVVYVVRQNDPPPAAAAAAKPEEAPAPRPVKVEKKKERPPAVEVVGKQPPEPAKVLTFDEAWAEAEKIANDMDRQEPAKTDEAVKILTGQEMSEFSLTYRNRPLGLSPEGVGFLRRLGLTEHLAQLSRRVARESTDFKAVSKSLWEPTAGPNGIVAMMNFWGTIPPANRQYVIFFVTGNRPTSQMDSETRDYILGLGGRRWLAR